MLKMHSNTKIHYNVKTRYCSICLAEQKQKLLMTRDFQNFHSFTKI